MEINKNKNKSPSVRTSTEVATAKTKTFSPTSMKLIAYGLYKLAYSFDVEKYKNINLFNMENWKNNNWQDFSCSFSTKEFCDALGLTDGGQQRIQIEAAIDKAFDEKIKLKDENKTLWFPWFIEAMYYHPASSKLDTNSSEVKESSDKSITFTFHPGVLAIALNQKSGYAYIDLPSYGKLKSTYALKWYQIIKARYNMRGKYGNPEGVWTTDPMTIQDLRELFAIGITQYVDRTNNLITKVLKKPIQEINDAGFNFSAEIIFNRGLHNRVDSFIIKCEEKVRPRVLPKNATLQEKEDQNEIDSIRLQSQLYQERYPEEWAKTKKELDSVRMEASGGFFLFPEFDELADLRIIDKMKEKGYMLD